MTDEDLIGYLLNALDATDRDRASLESCLQVDPTAAARLGSLRRAVAMLETERLRDLTPPDGLAVRTIAHVAAHLVAHDSVRGESPVPSLPALSMALTETLPTDTPLAEPVSRPLPHAPREEPEARAIGGRLRLDLFVAAGIFLFGCGLLFSAVGKIRTEQQLLACQSNLRMLYTGLVGYADTHDGRYPQVGLVDHPTAGTFAAALVNDGQVPTGYRLGCPGAETVVPAAPPSPPVGYTYSLGYRTPDGGLIGLRRPDGPHDEHDLIPISADYPTAGAAPVAGPISPHHNGMNVLSVGGNVRLTTTALIGPYGDDIYRSRSGKVEAGKDRTDVVLGRPTDRP